MFWQSDSFLLHPETLREAELKHNAIPIIIDNKSLELQASINFPTQVAHGHGILSQQKIK